MTFNLSTSVDTLYIRIKLNNALKRISVTVSDNYEDFFHDIELDENIETIIEYGLGDPVVKNLNDTFKRYNVEPFFRVDDRHCTYQRLVDLAIKSGGRVISRKALYTAWKRYQHQKFIDSSDEESSPIRSRLGI